MSQKHEAAPSCVLCGKAVEPWPTSPGEQPNGYGHNPDPCRDHGRACDACNAQIVIPTRLASLYHSHD